MIKTSYAICFGEVLWDVFDKGKQIGGAPLNVCYHLSQLGVTSKIVSQVGNDQDGKDILAQLHEMGLGDHYCDVSDTYPTSTVVVKPSGGSVTYEITPNVAWDHIPTTPQLFSTIQTADVFIYGSLAARSEVSRHSLYTYLKFANWKVFDINLRQSHYTRESIALLLGECDTLKVNDEELALLGKWYGCGIQPYEDIVAVLRAKFPNLSEIIITMGPDGAMYFADGEQLVLPATPVNVVNTVGCGDAFLAAFIANKLAHNPIAHCLQQAILLSAFVATQEGGCPKYSDNMRYIGS